jgi:hypothetical protein
MISPRFFSLIVSTYSYKQAANGYNTLAFLAALLGAALIGWWLQLAWYMGIGVAILFLGASNLAAFESMVEWDQRLSP